MAQRLGGKVAIVTGAGSGIGRAIALGYAKAGAKLVVLDVNAETAGQTASAINTAGGSACSYPLDVSLAEDCRSLAADIANTIGQASILVNNAGINRRNAFTAESAVVCKDWQDIMAINLNGVFNVTHAFLAQLRQTKGRIINIASIQVLRACAHAKLPSFHHLQARRVGPNPSARSRTGSGGRARQCDRSGTDRDPA